ncbi:MAG TPA: nucleoside triphosphate pyrophosphohydrolase [Candidatus Binataceae bacterium]|nr:nucleoside triphosphate pyrophosphohydrolase [Candidatus Binataceae bacterium]
MSKPTPEETAALARLIEVVRTLRRECPWDREQTLTSLSKYVIEEAYEAADAIERNNSHEIKDEFGDLAMQIILVAAVAEDEKRFSLIDLMNWSAEKLIRRHPHVYGDIKAETADAVVANWSRIKDEERKRTGAESALDGIARGLPALMRAEKLGSQARHAGMDWADIHAVLAKVREEMDEVEGALSRNDPDAAAEEIGDMLLALANAPRFIGHNAEEVLRRACEKFIGRFQKVEAKASSKGLELTKLSPGQIDELWRDAKEK